MNSVLVGRVARGAALCVAVLAVIDPALTSDRSSRPEVSVVYADVRDSALSRQVASRLSRNFSVLPVSFAGSAATVVVGSGIPGDAARMTGTVFGVVPEATGASLQIARMDVPARAAVDARVPVNVVVDARAARGRTVELRLLSDGNIVDRASVAVERDSGSVAHSLSFVPTASGVSNLRIEAGFGAATSASAEAVVDVRERKWSVLFFDPRPSWMSTFVRRAVERDTRFAVTSRVITSLNISTDAGRPPAALYDAAVMEVYDAIVVGAPETLGERDVQGLERFLRNRGGSVVLLFDGNRRGAYERLAPIGAFSNTSNSAGTVIAGSGTDSVALRATEWMWPAQLPIGARVLAVSDAHAGNVAARHPLVWSVASGAGRVVVSGALDSWKFRDPSQSAFEKFWQQTIAAAADAASPALELRVPTAPVHPGATVAFSVTSRAAALSNTSSDGFVRSTASAQLETPEGRRSLRVWPTATPGEFAGEFVLPTRPGTYRVSVTADGASETAPVVVGTGSGRAQPAEHDLLASWIAGKGGAVFAANRLPELASAVEAKVAAVERRVVWHPMRSAWWLLPFVSGLALDWWLRRKRGLA